MTNLPAIFPIKPAFYMPALAHAVADLLRAAHLESMFIADLSKELAATRPDIFPVELRDYARHMRLSRTFAAGVEVGGHVLRLTRIEATARYAKTKSVTMTPGRLDIPADAPRFSAPLAAPGVEAVQPWPGERSLLPPPAPVDLAGLAPLALRVQALETALLADGVPGGSAAIKRLEEASNFHHESAMRTRFAFMTLVEALNRSGALRCHFDGEKLIIDGH